MQPPAATTEAPLPRMPAKQKIAVSLKSLVSSVLGDNSKRSSSSSKTASTCTDLFPKTDPSTDGDDCLHDCDSCSVRYPRGFSIDEADVLYGQVKGWSTHLVIGTGKTDWTRDVADEKGSVMEAIARAKDLPTNGRLMVSASNMPAGDGDDEDEDKDKDEDENENENENDHDGHDKGKNHKNKNVYAKPTTVLLLPALTLVQGVHPRNVEALLRDVVSSAPTTASPLAPAEKIPASLPLGLRMTRCPHDAVVLLCSQRSRDARCGQSAPLLRKELERHLRPLGLHRDLHDERPGGVAIYLISHVGGHKYAANVIIYRRHNAFAALQGLEAGLDATEQNSGLGEDDADADVGAGQCIWLARVRPEHCENLVRYTILRGKLVKPESQLRGGFDRARGLVSW
ncbi:hypothetical protein E4U57_004722 [Claviceps arundinis]|uniref:Sucrose cleavage protein n=1 Tax=Claviceps arundinis TaxID=1623583 RepID=A0A9P7SP64_9HYPO|nr:hypothetical protein E4U57_004722 [Claviceps arundinis]KAG5965213.1 hypothetical protein E4U56_001861 [Claviceps arundinis]